MLRRSRFFLKGLDKVVKMDQALADVKDGAHIAVGGFGCPGVPHALISHIQKAGRKGLTVYSDSAGIVGFGLAVLMEKDQIEHICCSYVGSNPLFVERYLKGRLALEYVPQGTLAEQMRAGGAGIPAFYTATGYDTQRQTGGQIIKYAKDGTPEIVSEPKETRNIDGRWYVLEHTIRPEFALVKAHKADRSGNLVFRGMARNFNPVAAQCGQITIAEVEEVVENGEIHPDEVHLPGCYVHRIVHVPRYEIPIQHRTVSGAATAGIQEDPNSPRQVIARRAALEFADGMYVNLGTGIPTSAANYIPDSVSVTLQSENGLLGMGPYPTEDRVDADWINAGKQTISFLPAASCFDSAQSFAMIRGAKMDLTMLGAMEVAANGDLANWGIPGKLVKGPGGAMDLVGSGARVVATMTHLNKKGEPKILDRCTLPLTGRQCVSRIITEKCVFDVEKQKLVLKELAKGETVDSIKKATAAHFHVSQELKEMPLAPVKVVS